MARTQAAKKFLVAKLRKPLAPHLAKQGLAWPDVAPALEMVDSLKEIKEAATNPEGFLDKLAAAGGPVRAARLDPPPQPTHACMHAMRSTSMARRRQRSC